jgi:mannose-1-phosphate guanylyltransferase
LKNWGQTTFFLEPEGRNTDPATALAALHAVHTGGDSALLVLPADHLIRGQETKDLKPIENYTQ